MLKKARGDGIVMSRVPKRTRDFFMKLAEDAFADDYGLTLTFLVDEFIKNKALENIDIKTNYIISMLENKDKENNLEKKPLRKKRMLGGNEKIIEKEENQK